MVLADLDRWESTRRDPSIGVLMNGVDGIGGGGPGPTRTGNLGVRIRALYPVELRGRILRGACPGPPAQLAVRVCPSQPIRNGRSAAYPYQEVTPESARPR